VLFQHSRAQLRFGNEKEISHPKGAGGKNKLIKKIKKKSSYFSFSKVPIFVTIPPNYHLIRFILFP